MRPNKWIALILALCLLLAVCAAGLTEGAEPVDALPEAAEAAPAGSVDAETGLTIDAGESGEPTDVSDELPIEPTAVDADAPAAEAPEDAAVAAPALYAYAEVAADGAAVYDQSGDWQAAALLSAGDVVLVTGEAGSRSAVAFYADGAVMAGWMDALDLAAMSDEAVRACLDAAAASGAVGLYADDLNWPLPPLDNVSYGDDRLVLASNYNDYSIDTLFTLNGKQVSASMVPDTGVGNCWKWAQGIYKIVWGCSFSETFKGNASTGLNLLSNLNDAQRLLTPAHLKAFIQNTTPGATIRVCSCTSDCAKFNNDGLSCGHNGHSLIVVDKTADGVVTMDSHSNSQHTRFYSWQGFCNAWKGYTYVKYIKWPGASPLPADSIPEDGSTIAVTGVSLDQSALTLTVGQSATLNASIEPANATNRSVTWASSDAAVASVSNGVVTAVKAGTATVAVKTDDGGNLASCMVTVKKPLEQKALTRTGSNGTVMLALGEQLQLVPSFATSKGWQVSGAKSSKAKYASIDANGVVTALSVGKTKITVATKNKKKATLTVQVVDPAVPAAVALSRTGTVKLKVGDTLKLETAILPTTASTTLTWKSSKPKVAYVDGSGNVVALKKGSCWIAVRTANGKLAKVKIKVSK